ncbi:MAG: YceI family protein [Janthinobacterium lividum]
MKTTFAATTALTLGLALGLAAPGTASAQSASHEPSTVKSGTYAVEPTHTQVGFTLLHMGFSYYSGVFSNVSGTLKLDPAKPASDKLSVTIPIDSVATTSTKLDGELKAAEWFDAGQFPTATFVSNKIVPTGKDTARIMGTLTLHGVSKPETLVAHFVGAGMNPLSKKYTVGFEATSTIKRSDYGVKTYVPLIGDDVKLILAGAFELQS